MSEMATQERAPKRDKRRAAGDVVTANGLATHLGCTRQNIARLTAEAVIEQRGDGCYDQTASRLRYIRHLRAPRSARSEADAAHVRAKAEMLQIKIEQQRRDLVRRTDVDTLIDTIAGVVLTAMSGMAARCSRDPVVRRNIDLVVHEVRREMATVALQMADKHGEPPLDTEA